MDAQVKSKKVVMEGAAERREKFTAEIVARTVPR